MKNIYVGNLSFKVTADELRSVFAAYGEVSVVGLRKDRYSGQTKGFGFVEMPNDEEAQRAITALNGSSLKGHAIVVNEARHRPEKRRAG